jgi:hypothetical protein
LNFSTFLVRKIEEKTNLANRTRSARPAGARMGSPSLFLPQQLRCHGQPGRPRGILTGPIALPVALPSRGIADRDKPITPPAVRLLSDARFPIVAHNGNIAWPPVPPPRGVRINDTWLPNQADALASRDPRAYQSSMSWHDASNLLAFALVVIAFGAVVLARKREMHAYSRILWAIAIISSLAYLAATLVR